MTQLIVVSQPGCKIVRFGRASVVWDGIRAGFDMWLARRRQRAALLSLGDAELKDLGISRAQALFESSKRS